MIGVGALGAKADGVAAGAVGAEDGLGIRTEEESVMASMREVLRHRSLPVNIVPDKIKSG